MTNPTRAQVAKTLARYRDDYVAYVTEVHGFTPWSKQAEILRAVNDAARGRGPKFIAVKSGHKCGKSSVAAAAALAFLALEKRSRVVMTAPSAHQIQNILWREVRELYNAAERRGTPLGGQCNATAYTGLKFDDGRDLFGLSTDEPEKFAGISAPALLLIVEEASGVDERIFEAVFGNAAGGAIVLLISNPTRPAGTFFDAFHTKRSAWRTLHMASTDTPNFHGGSVPGLAAPEWVEAMKIQWGEHSPYFDVRVRGEFPSQSENAVVPLALVEAARARGRAVAHASDPPDALALGIDVARYGDDESVIAPRRGLRLYDLLALRGLDGPGVAGRALAHARSLARLGEVFSLRVDVIGVGASAYDSLAPAPDATVYPVNVSERAAYPDKYPNLRSQLWFEVREWLRAGGSLPDDERLAAELVAPVYVVTPRGQSQVSSKDEIKKLLKRSPDRADAVCLAVHGAAPTPAWGGVAGARHALDFDALRARLPGRRFGDHRPPGDPFERLRAN